VVIDFSVVLCLSFFTDELLESLEVVGIVMRLFLSLKLRLVIRVKSLDSSLAVGLDSVVNLLEDLV
jgi:hypothetical protein